MVRSGLGTLYILNFKSTEQTIEFIHCFVSQFKFNGSNDLSEIKWNIS